MVGDDGLAADQVFFEVSVKTRSTVYDHRLLLAERQRADPGGETFIKAWEAKYQQPTHTWGAMAADAYNVIVNAMNQCSDPHDRVCVNEKIRATKDFQG